MFDCRYCLAAVGLAFLSLGCGEDSDSPPLGPVSGVVTYNGAPVPDASVQFVLKENTETLAVGVGRTDSDGRYQLRSYDKDGVVLGLHTVSIIKLDQSKQDAEQGNTLPPQFDRNYVPPKSLIPRKYSHPSTSGLTAEVKEEDNVFDFELEGEI